MEDLFEIIMEIVLEGTLYTIGNKKVSLWIRIPLLMVIVLLFGFVIIGCFMVGVSMIKEEFFPGLMMIGISVFMLAAILTKYLKYKKKKEEDSYML